MVQTMIVGRGYNPVISTFGEPPPSGVPLPHERVRVSWSAVDALKKARSGRLPAATLPTCTACALDTR